jgi:toxin CcdB
VARFDVHRRPGAGGYLLDVQSNVTDRLGTRIVVPLLPPARVPTPIRDLHPVFEMGEARFVMATHLLAAMPRRELGRAVGSLVAERDAITRALDILLTGF